MLRQLFWCNGQMKRKTYVFSMIACFLVRVLIMFVFFYLYFKNNSGNSMILANSKISGGSIDITKLFMEMGQYSPGYLLGMCFGILLTYYIAMMQTVKRLRDTGLSLYLLLVVIAGYFVSGILNFGFTVFLMCYPSKKDAKENLPMLDAEPAQI